MAALFSLAVAALAGLTPAPPPATTQAEQGRSPVIRRIRTDGAAPSKAVQAVLDAHIGRPASQPEVAALLQQLSAASRDNGLAFYGWTPTAFDPASGELRVMMVPGFIERIDMPPDPKLRQVGRILMPLTTERPLTRRSYQRRMGLAAALPGVALTTRLETGREKGGLVLVVQARREGASLRLGVTNKAASTVGDHLFDVSTTFPDVIAPGDYLSATYARSSRPERFRVLGAQYGAPVGADGLRITLAAAQARSRVLFGLLKGRLSYYSAGVSYPLVQTEALTLAGTLGFDRYDSDNAFIDYRISSDRSRALRLGVQFRHRAPRRALGLDIIWSQGLDIMTARATPGRSQSGFRKVKLDAAFDQQIGPSLYARARATMQATRSLLPDVEILSLGGDTLRGVRTGQLFGDSGGTAQAELRWTPASGREAYLFADHGWASFHRRPPCTERLDQSLTSAGVGLRVAAARTGVEGDVAVAHIIAADVPRLSGVRVFATARLKISR